MIVTSKASRKPTGRQARTDAREPPRRRRAFNSPPRFADERPPPLTRAASYILAN